MGFAFILKMFLNIIYCYFGRIPMFSLKTCFLHDFKPIEGINEEKSQASIVAIAKLRYSNLSIMRNSLENEKFLSKSRI